MKTLTQRSSMAWMFTFALLGTACDGVEPESDVESTEEADAPLSVAFDLTKFRANIDAFLTAYGQAGKACENTPGGRKCVSLSQAAPAAIKVGDPHKPDPKLFLCSASATGTLSACGPVADNDHGCGSGLCGCAGFDDCLDMIANDCRGGTADCKVYSGELRCLCLPE